MLAWVILAPGVLLAAVAVLTVFARRRRDLGTAADRSTFETLHRASLAAPSLRLGLDATGAEAAIRHLHGLLATTALAITDTGAVLATHGDDRSHSDDALAQAGRTLASGVTTVLGASDLECSAADCPVRCAVVAPLLDGDTVVGSLVVYARSTSAVLVRAVEEVANWVSAQLELASADAQRSRLVEAELRALRAQISPHFIYNSLTAIASFTRTDPDRARQLLLEFADFTRYALRRGDQFATLSDELRNTERYLVLEQARFGDRLRVSLRVAPETLQTAVPFLVVQPVVENAVRHGLEGHTTPVRVSISAADDGADALVVVEDDGAGADPDVIRAALESGGQGGRSVGLGNVDARLRQVFGDAFGLVIETAPGAGTKVSIRVPKFAPSVHARSAAPPPGPEGTRAAK